ncbi:MAG: hypothetical protein E7266_02600 [Lachnospiraceae bacterium]|nr:hypothetical protein [Lachnospiraceae bacterium]
MIKIMRKKLNNSGSTLVLTMMIIAFLTIIASVILAASSTNLAMRQVANVSKNTFYSAEAAVDEINAGLKMTTMDCMSSAYVEVASSLVEITTVGGITVAVEVNNDVANMRLKEHFIDNVFYAITDVESVGYDSVSIGTSREEDIETLEHIKQYLGDFLTNPDAAYIDSISGVSMVKKNMSGDDVYSIIFEDVVIKYCTEEGYFSNVTVDVSVKYPDIKIGFQGEKGKLSAFAEYALIADGNINFEGNKISVENNILAGRDINIYNGSKVTVNGNGAVNVVSGNDINVISDGMNVVNGLASALYIKGCDIWCENITLSTTTGTTGPTLDIDDDSNTYIKDDLNINGMNSNATIAGKYYGYSYEGYSALEGKEHDKSSAIIVNGKKSSLSLEATNILIGGHAYINFGDAAENAYMTGESLSVKGNQEIYMMVDQYILGEGVDGEPVQNPMSYEDWMKISEDNAIIPIDIDRLERRFYAYDLLNEEQPYIIKYVESKGSYYVYLNFESKAASAKYFMTIISDSYFDKLYPDATVAQKEERGALKNIVNTNLVNMLDDEGKLSIKNGATIMSSGAVFEVSTGNNIVETLTGTNNSFTDGSNYAGFLTGGDYTYNDPSVNISGLDNFALSSLNFGNRFEIISHLCLDIQNEKNDKEFIVCDPCSVFDYKGETYTVTNTDLNTTPANNIVDFDEIKRRGYNTECVSVSGSLVTAVDGSVNVESTVTRGIILATGDVTINGKEFTGIIITQGNVKIVNDDAKISNCELNMIPRYENIVKYLYAFKDVNVAEGESIDDVIYSEIVKISNWRKNEE